jgi:hypothetical protein
MALSFDYHTLTTQIYKGSMSLPTSAHITRVAAEVAKMPDGWKHAKELLLLATQVMQSEDQCKTLTQSLVQERQELTLLRALVSEAQACLPQQLKLG